jgi:hypothetical protein
MDSATDERANVSLHACLVDQNHHAGLVIDGSDATIESTVIRTTLPDELGNGGFGMWIGPDSPKKRAKVSIYACLIEQNHNAGLVIGGSDVTIESTVIRSTWPNAQGNYGFGIDIEGDVATQEHAIVLVRSCVIEENQDMGIFIAESDATIEASIVRYTASQSDNKFGDGIAVFKSVVTIQDVEVTRNARAGVSSFGGKVVITGGVITCNGFDIEGEPFENTSFTFDGSTGWQCSDKPPAECTELGACHVETTGIKAPSKLPPADPLPPPPKP